MSTAVERAKTAECCDDEADMTWGRLPGAEPPLAWWLPMAAFGVAAVLITLVILLVVRAPGPLDDPNPANQRSGLLITGPRLSTDVRDARLGNGPIVVLFERDTPSGRSYAAWRDTVSDDGVDLVVVVEGSPGARALAATEGIPTPVDGGFPIGYAVIDAARVVRYSTLDPMYELNAFEVDVITGAVG